MQWWITYDSFTSKPCNLPMSIMSLAWLGTTVMTWNALAMAVASASRPARWEYLRMASSNMWYLVSLWIGLIKRSVSRSLKPSFSRISWKYKDGDELSGFPMCLQQTRWSQTGRKGWWWHDLSLYVHSSERWGKVGQKGDKLCVQIKLLSHLEVVIDVFRDDEFWLWFVLTIDDVHLELAVVLLEEVAQVLWVLYRFFQIFQEEAINTTKVNK